MARRTRMRCAFGAGPVQRGGVGGEDERRFELCARRVGGRRVVVARPRDYDAAFGAAEAGGRPYWSVQWPAGEVLAELLAIAAQIAPSNAEHARDAASIALGASRALERSTANVAALSAMAPLLRVRRARVIDVGAGLGLCSLMSAQLGASDVLAADVDANAVAAVRYAARASGAAVRATRLDWRRPRSWPRREFDVVLAADVAYAAATAAPLAHLLPSLIAPGGTLIVAEQATRRHADSLFTMLRADESSAFEDDPREFEVTHRVYAQDESDADDDVVDDDAAMIENASVGAQRAHNDPARPSTSAMFYRSVVRVLCARTKRFSGDADAE